MIFLFSDLDRTLIPNGDQPESPGARSLFRQLIASGLIRLAYVSGRDKELVRQAINEFQLPKPDFVIGDVGTSLYRLKGKSWILDHSWENEISSDWSGYENEDIVELVTSTGEDDLELQPAEKQGAYKVSYYTDPGESGRSSTACISELLQDKGIDANLVWSIDEAENRGLLDILPAGANKISAIRFVMKQEKIAEERVVFAGDSGNDLDGLTSGLQAILVANAHQDIRLEAVETARSKGFDHKLYLAHGEKYTLNGNYSAGVLEGLGHFFPELEDWLLKKIADQENKGVS